MRNRRFPDTMTVAPNSPREWAKVRSAPVISPPRRAGNTIWTKVCQRVAPMV